MVQQALRLAGCLVVLAALSIWISPPARAQVSPGPLARPHARLDFVDRCTGCHVLGKGVRDERCLACHKVLASRMRAGAGYHPRATKNGKIACKTCHMDHAGRTFKLIEWPGKNRDRFAHAKETGYELRGAHKKANCKACHAPKFIADDMVRVQKTAGNAIGRTFLGLETRCVGCHEDPHRGEVGVDCQSCHHEDAFKPAQGFDHQKAKFPLLGKHRTVACEKCHARKDAPATAKGVERLRWRGMPSDTCTACHDDPHAGRFGASCKSCHSNDGFKPSTYRVAEHARTGFPLSGHHAASACSSCHGEKLDRVVKGAACASCHLDRFHQGGVGTDCASCHTDAGWERPTYARETHARDRLPLVGKHAAATCERCHASLASGGVVESLPPGAPRVKATPPTPVQTFRVPLAEPATPIVFARATKPPAACAECHRKAHEGRLGTACQECHQPAGWERDVHFTVDLHEKTRYPLRGRHRALDCAQCHGKSATGGLDRLAPLDHARCQACHKDAHKGQLAKRTDGGRCESCHTAIGFKPAQFDVKDHQKLRFPLVGKHVSVDCARCHRAKGGALNLKPAHSECRACHDDPHEGQLGRSISYRGCVSCHDAGGWKPKRFDHAKTRFTLLGKHRDAACIRCHVVVARRPGYDVRLYRPLPAGCAGCHKDPHLGQFKAAEPVRACGDCHSEQRFKPADRFDHTRMTRFALDGKHAEAACTACHDRIALGGGLFTVRYRATPAECRACHADQHQKARWRR